MSNSLKYLMALTISACFSACNVTRNVPDRDALYMGATVRVENTTLPAKEKKKIQKEAESLPRPAPNSRILGIPLKLLLYNLGGDPKKGGMFRNFFHRAGEPPVLLSQLNISYNMKVLQNYLQNTGYFQAAASGDTTVKNKKAKAHYTLTPGPVYTISHVQYDVDSGTAIGSEIAKMFRRSLLKPGKPFNLETVKAERARIDARLKYRGYFYFNPDYLLLNVDSTIENKKLDMHLAVKANTPGQALKPYIVNGVYIYTDYQLRGSTRKDNRDQIQSHKGYFISDPTHKFRPSLFSRIMVFDSGDVYNLRAHNASLSRLIGLDVFKFVKNRFELSGQHTDSDTGRLDVYYYLTPKPKKSLKLALSGNTKSNNFVGTEVQFTFRNRNSFRAAEHLDVYANAGSEVQYSGFQKGYNSYKFGGGVKFTFPRFVIPFYNLNTDNSFVPQTIIDVNYSILNWQKLYTLNSFKSEWGYNWKPNVFTEHQFNPISVNFVKPTNVTQKYRDSVLNNPLLSYAVSDQNILGNTYSYTLNRMINKPRSTGIYFNAIADISGNISGLVTSANTAGEKKILGTKFAQYLKTQFDFRYYRAFNTSVQLANRAIIGIGYPYGNSRQLPFVKQFFAGGVNSLRAFKSRSIGPGTFRDSRSDNPGFFSDQGGDLKLELNSELRFRINNIIEPAVFVDAGNIWLVRDDVNQPGGRISRDFLSELAVGAGAGLRLDFSILILRLDVAIPLREPWLPPGDRWVLNRIDPGDKDWRRKNLILNLAIGYPF